MRFRRARTPERMTGVTSYLQCGICHVVIHSTAPGDLRYPEVIAYEAETACEEHLLECHPLRYSLWKKLGWRWLVGGLAP